VTAETWKIAQAAQDGHGAGTGPADAGHGAAATAAEGAAHGGGSGIDPMHQFEIKRILHLDLFGLDISFTNSAAFMLTAVGLISIFLIYAMRDRSLVPGRVQSTAEIAYQFVANMVRENTGREGMQYFPFIFSLFIFILTLNMLGMVPYAFTVTSHIIVTFALALMVFLFVLIVGFVKNGPGFVKLFVPSGVPGALLPLITVLEVFSFLIRPISLSVRLFANMMAGHMMLKVFAAFVVGLGVIGGWAPLAFMVAFTGLELLVAFLQAFVFTVLTCIYLNDALHMHH
jgi:F-type H+-transporting ATPase subunit a